MIGKKNEIINRSTYYKFKLNKEDLSLLTKALFKPIDEYLELIKNIFEKNKYKIKGKFFQRRILILRIYGIINGKEMDIELISLENYEIQNIRIKYLFNSYMNIEKEIYALKNNK